MYDIIKMSKMKSVDLSLMLSLCATCRTKRYVTRSVHRTCTKCRKLSSKIEVLYAQRRRSSNTKNKSKTVNMQTKNEKNKSRSRMKDGKKIEHPGTSSDVRKVSSSKVKVKSPWCMETITADMMEGMSISTPKDVRSCWIKGCVMIPDSTILAATDYKNTCVKLVDVQQKTVVSELWLPGCPWGITYVQPGDLAVTLPNSKLVQFLTVRRGTSLSRRRKICMSGTCHGITYNNNRLFVSFSNPGRVQIVSMSGEVLKDIDSRTDEHIHFTNPYNLISSVDFSSVYVSDCNSNTVYCLDNNGKVKATYKDDGLSCPTGACAIDGDCVVVCGYWSHNLNVLSSDCSRGRILVEKEENIHGIYQDSVAYCKALSSLYVFNADDSSDTVKVYRLK